MKERPVELPKKSAKSGCCCHAAMPAETPGEEASQKPPVAEVEPKEQPCCGGGCRA